MSRARQSGANAPAGAGKAGKWRGDSGAGKVAAGGVAQERRRGEKWRKIIKKVARQGRADATAGTRKAGKWRGRKVARCGQGPRQSGADAPAGASKAGNDVSEHASQLIEGKHDGHLPWVE